MAHITFCIGRNTSCYSFIKPQDKREPGDTIKQLPTSAKKRFLSEKVTRYYDASDFYPNQRHRSHRQAIASTAIAVVIAESGSASDANQQYSTSTTKQSASSAI